MHHEEISGICIYRALVHSIQNKAYRSTLQVNEKLEGNIGIVEKAEAWDRKAYHGAI